jgi:integrase
MCFGKKNNGLIITKDLFLFSCYTGLRFGDVISLNKKEVEKDRIVKEMEKVSKKIEIPLIPEAKLILEKYGYKFTDGYIFPYRSNVSMNRDLKFIANELKIDKKLTFHIARHTFGSILGMNKVSPFNIMKLMGHGDVRMTSRYVNTNSKILEGVMKEVSF